MKAVIVSRLVFFFCLFFTAQTIYGVLFSTRDQIIWRLYDPMSYVFLGLAAIGLTYLQTMRKRKAEADKGTTS